MVVTIFEMASDEVVMKLFLAKDGGRVVLRGYDKEGREWSIASIGSDGIHLVKGINKSIGWPVEADGTLKLRPS